MNAMSQCTLPTLEEELCRRPRRALICGAAGTDRLTAGVQIASRLEGSGADYLAVSANPALPAFGVPGAIAAGVRLDGNWVERDREALCTLDALRFRLPLSCAVAALVARQRPAGLLLLAPGMGRGAAGAELLHALLLAARIDCIAWLASAASDATVPEVLLATQVPVYRLTTLSEPAPGKPARREYCNELWRQTMRSAHNLRMPIARLQLLGAPPSPRDGGAWSGRQVALLRRGRLLGMGELQSREHDHFHLRMAGNCEGADQLLLRDAMVLKGIVRSASAAKSAVPPAPTPLPKAPVTGIDGEHATLTKTASCGPVPTARVGSASACVVNGVFGDALLKLHLLHQRRQLLFDLGDPGRLAAKVAHQVSDVFFSHAHADHIGGFIWFLRSRIGELPTCRCHGPAGLARHIAGMVSGILWDRVGERAPRFEVREWHGDHLERFMVVAGKNDPTRLDDLALVDGIIWRENAFTVSAALLDHRTPVLAYAWQPAAKIKVLRDRLEAAQLQTGRWLQLLKQAVMTHSFDELLAVPGNGYRRVSELRDEFLMVCPGEKLVYATDFADTPQNRERLVDLARGAHSLFCEATFMLEHHDQALRTQHLTTRACGQIASAAGVNQLLPFHFSKRYIKRVGDVYSEIASYCDCTVLPPFMQR